MTLRYDIQQGTPEWHALRSNYIGGSEVAALFNLASDDTPAHLQSRFALFNTKSGRTKPMPLDDGPGSRIWFGKRKEPTIAQMAAELYGWKIRPGPYAIDDVCEGMAASFDFVIDEPDQTGLDLGFEGPGYLEIKNVDWLVHKRSWTGGEPPFHTLLQHQHGIACAGFGWGAIVCEIGGNELSRYVYKAQPRVADTLREHVAAFWADVRAGRVPNTDGSESTADALRQLFPTVQNELPVDLRDVPGVDLACVNFLTCSANRKASDEAYDKAKAQMEEILQGKTLAECPGFRISVRVTKASEDRPAPPGHIIKGRKSSRSIHITEVANQ